ncbi:MAG: hypothetical protein AB1679_28675 [Actinomycetota bacterium]|jgi:hypothetical protein
MSDAFAEDEGDFDPEAAERAITEFIDSAEALAGLPVAELVDLVEAVMADAWERIEGVMSGQPHNKVLAAQLLLSQRARARAPGDPEQWRLYAASTLLSGMIAIPPAAH